MQNPVELRQRGWPARKRNFVTCCGFFDLSFCFIFRLAPIRRVSAQRSAVWGSL